MKIKKVAFGELKRGDRFALSTEHFKTGTDEYMNIKVAPAVLCDAPFDPPLPFNVLSLGDARVRTFRDEECVFVLEDERE